MADEVKLITFAGETVSPLYDGLMQELYTGGGGIITGAVVTIKDASTLHITGGYGALCGREFEIFASDIPVTLSSSGTLKGRLYLHMDLAQSGAPIELLVEVAASLTPVVQDSDVNTTNGVYEVNLATFDVGTSAISNLVDVSPKLSKIPDQISLLNSALEVKDLSANVTLDTYGRSLGSSTFYRIGNIVIVNLDVNIAANTPVNGAVLQGLPIPLNNGRAFTGGAKADGGAIRINVTAAGKVVAADANNSAVWVSASFSYVAQ